MPRVAMYLACFPIDVIRDTNADDVLCVVCSNDASVQFVTSTIFLITGFKDGVPSLFLEESASFFDMVALRRWVPK